MMKQDSRPMSGSGYGGRNNDRRLRNMSNSRSSQARASVDAPSSPSETRRDRGKSSCCFSCCGLSAGGSGERPSGSRASGKSNNKQTLQTSVPAQDSELQPTADDVKSWGEGFENVMAGPIGRKWFRDFLRCEYSEENILFWLACEDLKKETNPETVEEKARIIYEDYISILSPKEVSLDSRVREIINRNMVEPSRQTFDEAQIQIFTLMSRDSYPRFINSTKYRDLVDTLLKPQSQNNSGASLQSNPAQPTTHNQPQSSSRNSGLNRDRGSSSAS